MAIIQRMVKVRLVTDGKPDGEIVSVPLRDDPAVVSAIRRSLPKLRRDMRKRWPMLTDLQIRQKQRLRNPAGHASAFMLADVRMVLAAIFTSQIAVEFAKEVIRPSAKEVGEYLRRWVQKFTKPKSKGKRKTRKRR
jgi:hypothetical protein